MLSLAVLAGYGLHYIFCMIKRGYPGKSARENGIFIIISCLILFEFLAVPFPMSSAEIPAIYKQMKAEADDYAILEIPGTGAPNYMYFQTLHGKKLVNGYVSRTPGYTLEFMSIPLISDLISTSNTPPIIEDIIKQKVKKQNQTELLPLLRHYHIHFMIVHKGYLSDKEFSLVVNQIHDALGIEPVAYDSEGLWVYPIPDLSDSFTVYFPETFAGYIIRFRLLWPREHLRHPDSLDAGRCHHCSKLVLRIAPPP